MQTTMSQVLWICILYFYTFWNYKWNMEFILNFGILFQILIKFYITHYNTVLTLESVITFKSCNIIHNKWNSLNLFLLNSYIYTNFDIPNYHRSNNKNVGNLFGPFLYVYNVPLLNNFDAIFFQLCFQLYFPIQRFQFERLDT